MNSTPKSGKAGHASKFAKAFLAASVVAAFSPATAFAAGQYGSWADGTPTTDTETQAKTWVYNSVVNGDGHHFSDYDMAITFTVDANKVLTGIDIASATSSNPWGATNENQNNRGNEGDQGSSSGTEGKSGITTQAEEGSNEGGSGSTEGENNGGNGNLGNTNKVQYSEPALINIIEQLKTKAADEVDTVSGATYTSRAIVDAIYCAQGYDYVDSDWVENGNGAIWSSVSSELTGTSDGAALTATSGTIENKHGGGSGSGGNDSSAEYGVSTELDAAYITSATSYAFGADGSLVVTPVCKNASDADCGIFVIKAYSNADKTTALAQMNSRQGNGNASNDYFVYDSETGTITIPASMLETVNVLTVGFTDGGNIVGDRAFDLTACVTAKATCDKAGIAYDSAKTPEENLNAANQAIAAAKKATPVAQKITAKKATVTKTFKASKKTKKLASAKTVWLKSTFKLSAKTSLSYKKTYGNAKIVVAKTGKVTVKKGLKKGTYKVKVRATAKATASYKVATKLITLIVKVK